VRLIPKPVFFPGKCHLCQHSAEDFGPYLDTDRHDAAENRRIYFCRSCTGELVRAVDVVSKKDLLDALAEVQRLEDVERQACEYAAEAAASAKRVTRLEGELAGVRGENESLRGTVRTKEQEAAKVRLELLRADIATPAKPTTKEKTAA
jgi:hypothetical protein